MNCQEYEDLVEKTYRTIGEAPPEIDALLQEHERTCPAGHMPSDEELREIGRRGIRRALLTFGLTEEEIDAAEAEVLASESEDEESEDELDEEQKEALKWMDERLEKIDRDIELVRTLGIYEGMDGWNSPPAVWPSAGELAAGIFFDPDKNTR